MNNDLKNFLEEEITDFGIDFGHAKNCDLQPPNDGEQMCSCGYEQVESAVKSMNTRLINFVLELVEKEVNKKPTAYFLAGEAFIRSNDIDESINSLKV